MPEKLRLLVIANEAAATERLRGAVGAQLAASPRSRVLVVAPAVDASPQRRLPVSEGARRAAVRRLQACVALLSEHGIDAEGMIGDANPVRAIEDALRIFPADAVLVATLTHERFESRLEGALERARVRFDLPTTQLVVDAV